MRERQNGVSAGADKPRLRLVPSLPAGGEERRIRVVVVDDHPLLRDAIRIACEPVDSIEIVGEAATGPGALEACARYTPDVVVLDVGLPGLSGLDVARTLKSSGSRTRILVLTGSGERSSLFEARRIGVDGFVEKDLSIMQIPETILDVAAGKRAFSSQQEHQTNQHLATMIRSVRESARVASKLTERELDVLKLIAAGCTTRQTAGRLHLSQRTIESHIAKLYTKLGARTRVQAVVRASKLGLLASVSERGADSPEREVSREPVVAAHSGSQMRRGS